MQQPDNICFLQILRVPLCELWQVKDRRGSCKSRGALQVLHSKSLNLFLLKFNDFYFALDKNLQVTGTYSETGKWHSFLLPTFSGFYIIKALESQPGPIITNLETILSNTTLYSQKTGLDEPLGLYSSDEVHDIEMKESGVRSGLSRITEAFSKMMAPSTESDSHPNQKLVRSFQDLLDVDSPGVHVVDVPADHVNNFKLEVSEIIRNHQGGTEWMELRGEERPLRSRADIPETGIHSEIGMMGPSGFELRGAAAGLQREEPTLGGSKTLTREHNEPKEKHHHHLLHHHEHGEGHHHHLGFLHHSHGACNIETCQNETGQDQQEVVGMENQRLPSYEIENPKEHLVRGFRKASVNLGDPTESMKIVEAPGSKIEETDESEFTTGLFSNAHEILGRSKDNFDQPLGEDLSRENLKFEKWGSNITNASESTIKEDPFTGQTLGYSLGTRTHFGDPNFTKENVENLNKQGQTQTTTSILQEKTNLSAEQKPSEKSKSKSSTQAVDKENVGGTYVI